MKRVTIRVPATTANLGPGFDAFGCALSLYTDVTFEETEAGLEITGCDEEYTGPDNLAYVSYCAALATMSEELRGVKIHIEAQIPVCRGLGSSAALLVAGAMGANVLRGNKLSTQGLLNITNAMEGTLKRKELCQILVPPIVCRVGIAIDSFPSIFNYLENVRIVIMSDAAEMAAPVTLIANDAVGGTTTELAAFDSLGSTYITSFCCK